MGTALITGASSGLGLEFAWQLATAKHDLVLVARDEARLTDLAQQLHQVAGVDVEVLVADLSVLDEVERVADRLRLGRLPEGDAPDAAAQAAPAPGVLAPVGLLVNNAGHGLGQSFVGGDLAHELSALDVMVRAVMVLSHAAAGQMVSRGRGAIVNVSSVAALLASGTYSAHKAWVRTFTESLAVELRGTGVTTTVVAPGLTRTEFHERAALDEDGLPDIAWLSAEQVVRQTLDAARRGQVIVTPSWRYQLAAATVRALPRAVVRGVGRTGLQHRD